VQKDKKSYSVVAGFSIQDASLQESMGPIQDHACEALVVTDRAIMLVRRMLYKSAIELENGREPPALAAAVQRVRSASVVFDRSIDVKEWAQKNLNDGLNQPVFTL
jgi:phthalate 4,5-dioxygenase